MCLSVTAVCLPGDLFSPGARSSSHPSPTLNEMFPGNGVQRGLRYVFSCLVGVSKMSVQSAATCI